MNALTCAFNQRMHGLQIDVPATLRHVVGMADAMPELRTTAADFTDSCHKGHFTRIADATRKPRFYLKFSC